MGEQSYIYAQKGPGSGLPRTFAAILLRNAKRNDQAIPCAVHGMEERETREYRGEKGGEGGRRGEKGGGGGGIEM